MLVPKYFHCSALITTPAADAELDADELVVDAVEDLGELRLVLRGNTLKC